MPSTNSVATIFAWTGALRKRGELDEIPELCNFANKLEQACIETIESGVMTKSLSILSSIENKKIVDGKELLLCIKERLDALLA